MDPREVYPDPIPQGIYAPVGIRNPVPKRVAFATAYEHLANGIIDEFQHQSWFFDHMPRMELVDTVHGGATTTYKYYRTANLASATAREYNSEVSETYVELAAEETNIANLASAISMDVDLMNIGGITNQWNMQMSFAVQGIADLFNEMVIRGDSSVPRNSDDRAVGPGSFDGLHKIIQKESLHVWDETLDLTGLGLQTATQNTAKTITRSETNVWLDEIDRMMSRIRKLRPYPTFILGNDNLISALSALGRRTGVYQMTKNEWGQPIGEIEGIQLIPMGKRCAQNRQIIETVKSNTPCRENPDGTKPEGTFETTAYVGSFGPNAIQGLQLPGELVSIRMPDFSSSGYVKKADIEMHIGMAVMSRHACGMFTKVCVPRALIEFPKYIDDKK